MSRGANVTFRYSTPASTNSSTNWIAVYSAGQLPNTGWDTAYKFTPGARGSATFSTGSFIGSGRYDVYYMYKDTYQVLAGPFALTVTGAHPTITASATSVRNGSQVTYRYSAPTSMQASNNWIAIYSEGHLPARDGYTTYQWAAGASGSVTFSTKNLPGPGVYHVFYLYKGLYEQLGGPLTLSVTGS